LEDSGRFLLRWQGTCRECTPEDAWVPQELAQVMTAVRDKHPWLLYK